MSTSGKIITSHNKVVETGPKIRVGYLYRLTLNLSNSTLSYKITTNELDVNEGFLANDIKTGSNINYKFTITLWTSNDSLNVLPIRNININKIQIIMVIINITMHHNLDYHKINTGLQYITNHNKDHNLLITIIIMIKKKMK